MAGKKNKKKNPNKIPVSPSSFDVTQLMAEATEHMVLRAWLLVLCSLSEYYETTTDDMVQLWRKVNAYSKTIQNYADVQGELQETDKVLDRSLPWAHISSKDIRTQGALDKFKKKLHQNAMYSAFVLIAHPLIRERAMPEERVRAIFDNAYALDEEVYEGRISLADIANMLVDDYGVLLRSDDGRASFSLIGEREEVSSGDQTDPDRYTTRKEEKKMTKVELIEKIAEKTGMPKNSVGKMVNAYSEAVIEALQGGEKVAVAGFGSFEVRDRAEREAINPQTKEKVIVPACKVPAWKPAKAVKDALKAK